jgi:hypothetical protein
MCAHTLLLNEVLQTYLILCLIQLNFILQIILSETIIRGILKTPNSQLVTPISMKLQRPDGCD